MTGMARDTGTRLGFNTHLAQSIADILGTPKGTRVMRRAYGSDIPDLIDAPINGETVVDLYQAVAESVGQWEPRLTLTRVQVLDAAPGHLTLALDGDVTGRPTSLSVEVAA
ncbi:hypothetical protein ROE7235_03390 [Roseibaca ekhonensis]|uniref:IraD/Gp25-like domain-containing protein n=1 Tax=Roseinatronobacter ekhonensis TaxID=254356 RepID=A0A3B0MRG9_9RHOB|nr:GPW/gp25 family protein [Roseibaca ekhonensis]SUZ33617.1 hypothetical protein ROE7235_03390 [Roseibaca ekhonensis]